MFFSVFSLQRCAKYLKTLTFRVGIGIVDKSHDSIILLKYASPLQVVHFLDGVIEVHVVVQVGGVSGGAGLAVDVDHRLLPVVEPDHLR